MMKNHSLILFLFSTLWLHAQVTLSGKIVDEKGNPLQGASVYVNNTTIGTNSDADGYFKLSVEHGYYSLVASYVGLETSGYNVNTLELPNEIVFVLNISSKKSCFKDGFTNKLKSIIKIKTF